MLDLPSALRAWRQEMSGYEAVGVEELAELESHLLDDFDALCADGHEAENAFELAVRRLGSSAALHAEFAKRDPRALARERALWAVLGILAWWMLWKPWSLLLGQTYFLLPALVPQRWRGRSWLFGEEGMSEGYAIALALVGLAVLYVVLRSLESPRAMRWLFRLRRVTQYPVRGASLVVAALVVMGAVPMLPTSAFVRMYRPEVFVQAGLMGQVQHGVSLLLTPLVLGAFLLRWRSAVRTDEDRQPADGERDARVPAPLFWMLLGVVGYAVLSGVLRVLQALLNGLWIVSRPDSLKGGSFLQGHRYGVSEVEMVLLVLVLLTALLLLMRAVSLEWLRGRVGGVLRLMDRPARFWAVFLLFSWLPTVCPQALRIALASTTSLADIRSLMLLNAGTHMMLTLALQLAVLVTFLLLVKRGRSASGGEVERAR